MSVAGASCTSHSEGGLPPRPLRASKLATTPAPMSLTASDGTGLRLVSLKARAVVEEPLAFTELHLVFQNPTDRTIEGRFEITMPPHAAISRYAMKIEGAWQEGEVVERRAAQVAFEDALHRKQDPALLENKAGNGFSARVFPIFAHERKELIVSYSQELTSSAEPYRLMLRGLPELAELDASVVLKEPAPAPGVTSLATSAAQTRVIELKRQGWTPDQDLEVRSSNSSPVVGLRNDTLAVARVSPAGAMPPAPIGGLTVLFDTSASRALDFDRQLVNLSGLLASLREQTGEDFALRVVCFDQTTAEIYAGPASGFGTAQLESISTRRALGASDLRGALAAVATGPVSPRLLIVSDGVATAGATELSQLEAAARVLADAGVQRIDAIVDGGIQDASTLKAVATAGLPDKGIVADGRLPAATLAHKLASATLPTMQVRVPGAGWVWPEKIEGAQPGDELLVYAHDLPPDAVMKVVLTGTDEIVTEVPGMLVERPLLERAWIGTRIDRLTRVRSTLGPDDRDAREALKQQIVEMSTKNRVLSDFTAMLVLETDWDYARFNIDRTALTDILTVGATGVTLQNRRTAPPLPATPTALADADAGRHKGEEGRMGKPSDSSRARDYDPEMEGRQAGILGQMQADAGHFLASPHGAAFAAGDDDADVWGGLTGTEI
ncbi:MAG TPA: VIT and VWA domain-containing protein, partial [Nannocystis sp.]